MLLLQPQESDNSDRNSLYGILIWINLSSIQIQWVENSPESNRRYVAYVVFCGNLEEVQ